MKEGGREGGMNREKESEGGMKIDREEEEGRTEKK